MLAERSLGRREGSIFNSYFTWFAPYILDLYFTMLSGQQAGIK